LILRYLAACEHVKKNQHRRWLKPNSLRVNSIKPQSVSLKWLAGLLVFVGIWVCISANWSKFFPEATTAERVANLQELAPKSPASLTDLLVLPPSEVEHCDIALMDLLCAQGLPGAERLNVTNCLLMLDAWAGHVQVETERNLHQFRDNPGDFYNSEGYFRMLLMAAVVYEDFGIRYNPARMVMPGNIDPNDHFFADSRDIFIHGLIGDRRMGTCSSMPVLYIAIGRRLGYPLKLATTKAHLFIRWDDGTDRFDVEATGKGMNRYDDEHFKQWPFPVSDEEIRNDGYLKSLTPAEELAVFLSLRGNCLKEAGRRAQAASCYAAALRLAPGWNAGRTLLADVVDKAGVMANRLPPPPMPHTSVQQIDGPQEQSIGLLDPNPLQNIH